MDVGIERMFPLLLAEFVDVHFHHLVRMVVEENVDGAQLAQSLVHNFLAVIFSLQVYWIEIALGTVFLYRALGLLRVLLLFWQVRNEAVGALHGEENCCGTTNSRISSGNQRFLAFQLAGGIV